MSETKSLHWVTVDGDPFVRYGGNLVDPQTMELTEEGEALPSEVAKRLMHLIEEEFDFAACEANGCGYDHKTKQARPNVVGLHLSGDRDESTSWAFTTFVVVGDRVLVVCEECSPETIYDFDTTTAGPSS